MNIECISEILTVGGLRRNTPISTRNAADGVSTHFMGERAGKDPNGAYRQFSFDVKGKYKPKVRVYTDKAVNSRSGAWVTCNCNDFKYRWEVVLADRGSSKLKSADDVQPEIRNPQKKAGVCKHIYAALVYLRDEHGI